MNVVIDVKTSLEHLEAGDKIFKGYKIHSQIHSFKLQTNHQKNLLMFEPQNKSQKFAVV